MKILTRIEMERLVSLIREKLQKGEDDELEDICNKIEGELEGWTRADPQRFDPKDYDMFSYTETTP